MQDELQGWLLDRQARCNIFDAHLFACILARRWSGGAEAIGMAEEDLVRLLDRYYPAALKEGLRPPSPPDRLSAQLRDEQADLELLLLEHRSEGIEEEGWLASLVSRACLDDGPLWQSLGLESPRHLTALFQRHFEPLARTNPQEERWCAHLYRLLCRRDGLLPCSMTSCGACDAEAVCFGALG